MQDEFERFADWVIREREKRGWTQAMLADRAGLKRNDMNAIEKGRVALPGADKRRKLAIAFGIRHVDVLVVAGELTPDEISAVGPQGARYPAGSLQAEALEKLAEMDDRNLDGLVAFMDLLQNRRIRSSRDDRRDTGEEGAEEIHGIG